MLILMPDALADDDDGALERAVLGPDLALQVHRERDPDRIPAATWQAADALIVRIDIPVNEALLERLGKCRLIVRAGVGYDHIDLEACARRGLPVCNVPDYGTTEVADHAIALLLGLARGLVSYHQRLLADPEAGWVSYGMPLVRRLRGATFGVIGLGRIGLAAAKRAAAFDMTVAFYDPYLPDGTELAVGYRRHASLTDLLAVSDVVSLHCPLTRETRSMIDAAALAAVKPGALLINTARGALIDFAALEAALRGDQLAGVGLDVLPQEPPPADHPLLQAFRRREPWIDGRLLVTPHAAWFSPDGRADMRRKAAATARSYLQDGVLRNCVNQALLVAAAG